MNAPTPTENAAVTNFDRFLAEHPEHRNDVRYLRSGVRMCPPDVAREYVAWCLKQDGVMNRGSKADEPVE